MTCPSNSRLRGDQACHSRLTTFTFKSPVGSEKRSIVKRCITGKKKRKEKLVLSMSGHVNLQSQWENKCELTSFHECIKTAYLIVLTLSTKITRQKRKPSAIRTYELTSKISKCLDHAQYPDVLEEEGTLSLYGQQASVGLCWFKEMTPSLTLILGRVVMR